MNRIEVSRIDLTREELFEGLSQVEPIAREQLSFSGNGVELRQEFSPHLNPLSATFENRCYDRILTKPGESIVLGPHLVDIIFKYGKVGFVTRPDAILFDTSETGKWVLKELFEFKFSERGKSKNRGTGEKIAGFSNLLAILRQNPDYLPTLLVATLSGSIEIPKSIEIPDDSQITLTFIFSTRNRIRSSRSRPNTEFNLRYLRG